MEVPSAGVGRTNRALERLWRDRKSVGFYASRPSTGSCMKGSRVRVRGSGLTRPPHLNMSIQDDCARSFTGACAPCVAFCISDFLEFA